MRNPRVLKRANGHSFIRRHGEGNSSSACTLNNKKVRMRSPWSFFMPLPCSCAFVYALTQIRTRVPTRISRSARRGARRRRRREIRLSGPLFMLYTPGISRRARARGIDAAGALNFHDVHARMYRADARCPDAVKRGPSFLRSLGEPGDVFMPKRESPG